MKAIFLTWLLFLQAASPSTTGYGSIAGRVLLADGTPAANAWVGIAYVRGTPTAGSASQATTHTDNDGRYRLTSVPPGIYCVKAGIQVALTSACASDEPVVTVGFNAALENTNVRLTTAPGRRVAGRVVLEREGNAGLQLGAGMRVRLTGSLETNTSIDGTFELFGVPPGDYQAIVMPSTTTSTRFMTAPIQVIADRDTTGLELVVPRSALTSALATGAVTAEGGGPLPQMRVEFRVATGTVARLSSGAFSNGMMGVSPRDGTFSIELPIGEFAVTAATTPRAPAGYSVKSITAGPTNLLTDKLKVQPGDTPKISVVLAVAAPPPGVKVSGRVTGRAASSPAMTILIRSGIGLDPRFAPVNPDGSFEFTKVLPDRYSLYLIPNSDSFARTVEVGNTDVTNVSIPVLIPEFKVTGRLTGESQLRQSGRLLQNETMSLVLRETVAGQSQPGGQISSTLAPDGSFEFRGVKPGTYSLSIVRATGDRGGVGPTILTVLVVDRDITGLTVDATTSPQFGARPPR